MLHVLRFAVSPALDLRKQFDQVHFTEIIIIGIYIALLNEAE